MHIIVSSDKIFCERVSHLVNRNVSICNFSYFECLFRRQVFGADVPVPGHCLRFTFNCLMALLAISPTIK